jgi:hypothetical protein
MRCCTAVGALGVLVCIVAAPPARGDIISEIGGDTQNFVVLYDGSGANTLNQNNGTPEPTSIVLLVTVLFGPVLVIKRRSPRRKTA